MICVVVCTPVLGFEVIEELDRDAGLDDDLGVSNGAVGRIEFPVSVLTIVPDKSVEAAGSSEADVGGGSRESEAGPGSAE
jgi:hypothetical protein